MSDETPRRVSGLLTVSLAVALSLSACAVYRWRVPAMVEMQATVQVPAATDLGTLCQRPEVKEAAGKQFVQRTDVIDPPGSILGGQLFARKIRNAETQAAQSSGERSNPQRSTEAWEIAYRSNQAGYITQELTALLTVLKQKVQAADESIHDKLEPHEVASKIQGLEERLLNNELALELLNSTQAESPDLDQVAQQRELVADLQQQQAAAAVTYQELQAQADKAEDEFNTSHNLSAAADVVSASELLEAIRDLQKQARLSTELTELNQSEQRLSSVYGERHPKLIALQTRFEEALTELGGWDAVIPEEQLSEQLRTMMESIVSKQSNLEQSLSDRLESERDQLKKLQRQTEQIAQRSGENETLTKELSALRGSASVKSPGVTSFVVLKQPAKVELPWYLQTSVLYVLAAVCGLAAGLWLYRIRVSRRLHADIDDPLPMPAFSTMPAVHLDLAQRRAMRQARLRQMQA